MSKFIIGSTHDTNGNDNGFPSFIKRGMIELGLYNGKSQSWQQAPVAMLELLKGKITGHWPNEAAQAKCGITHYISEHEFKNAYEKMQLLERQEIGFMYSLPMEKISSQRPGQYNPTCIALIIPKMQQCRMEKLQQGRMFQSKKDIALNHLKYILKHLLISMH